MERKITGIGPPAAWDAGDVGSGGRRGGPAAGVGNIAHQLPADDCKLEGISREGSGGEMQGGSREGEANPGGGERRFESADNDRGALLRPEVFERKLEGVLVGHCDAVKRAVVVADIIVPSLVVGALGRSRETASCKECSGIRELHGRETT